MVKLGETEMQAPWFCGMAPLKLMIGQDNDSQKQ